MTGPLRVVLGCLLLVGCAGAASCERRPIGRGGGPTVQPGELQRIAGVIAGARCSRAELCQEIAPGGAYPDRAACLHDQQLVLQQELNLTMCGRGVDPSKLDACLDAVRDATCESPPQVLPLPGCRSHELCVK